MTYIKTRRQGIRAVAAMVLAMTINLPTGVLSGEEISSESEAMDQLIIAGPANQIATYKKGDAGDMPIMFLHGDSGRASQWEPVMQVLGGYSFDFSGHGASEPHGANDYNFAARAADLQAVVEAKGLERFVIVAHSGSVGVAFEYAGTHEDQVAGILLIDPAKDVRQMPAEMRQGFIDAFSGPGALEAVKGYYASIAGNDPAVVAQVLADAEIVDRDARLGIATALLNWNPEAAIAKYNGPVGMVIAPFNDNPTSLYHLMDGVTPMVISNTGHWMQLDAPEVVADAVKDFILTLNN